MTAACSSWERKVPSPAWPSTTRPFTPGTLPSQEPRRWMASWSTAPSRVKGVTGAGTRPRRSMSFMSFPLRMLNFAYLGSPRPRGARHRQFLWKPEGRTTCMRRSVGASRIYRYWPNAHFRYTENVCLDIDKTNVLARRNNGLRRLEALHGRRRAWQPEQGRRGLRHKPAAHQPPAQRA